MKYKKTLIAILSVLVISMIYIFAFPMKANGRMLRERSKFNTEEFVDGNSLKNTNKLVAENGNYKLYLDETTTYFRVEDIKTGEIIESNPTIEDPGNPIPVVKDRQKSTIEYRYFDERGNSSARIGNFSNSISHKETPNSPEGFRTFKIKEVEKGFQVLYEIKDLEIDYLYFPKYLKPEDLEPIIEEDGDAWDNLKFAYSDVKNKAGLYEIGNYENLSDLVLKRLYKVFYTDKVFGEYTRERSIEENIKYGYHEQKEKFAFDIVIQVLLLEKGIEISIINDSIVEHSKSKLSEINLYPYFGTAISQDENGNQTEGYIVLPDGSGAVMDFNNGKTTVGTYRKRLYGHDLGLLPVEMPETQEKILLPLYGMVKENIGFAAIIKEGDAMTTLNAAVSGINNDSYNKVYPTFILRERENVVLGSGYKTHKVDLWTRDIVSDDLVIEYRLLTGEKNSYAGIAKEYQNYLIEEKGLEKKDNTKEAKTVIEFLGAYNRRKFFLGVPYNSLDSLTTFKESEKIIDEIIELGVNNIDVVYSGAINGGLDNNLASKVKIEGTLGGKRNFKKLEKSLNEKGIDVFVTTNIASTRKFNKPFDQYKYSSKRIQGTLSSVFDYHIPSRLPYSETSYKHAGDHYTISPVYYETIFKKMNKSYKFNALQLDIIGSSLASNFIKNDELYKQESLKIQERLLGSIEDQKIMLEEPLSFAWPYVDMISDLPTEATLYTMLDYQIPLVQLVLNGYVDYTSKSINLASDRSIDYQFLKALETGSNLKYTLTHDNSLKLLNTDHNEYMSTEYTNWLEDIQKHNKIMNELKVHSSSLENHEKVADNVYKTSYSNGLVIYVNYNIFDVTIDGKTIKAVNYLAEGVA